MWSCALWQEVVPALAWHRLGLKNWVVGCLHWVCECCHVLAFNVFFVKWGVGFPLFIFRSFGAVNAVLKRYFLPGTCLCYVASCEHCTENQVGAHWLGVPISLAGIALGFSRMLFFLLFGCFKLFLKAHFIKKCRVGFLWVAQADENGWEVFRNRHWVSVSPPDWMKWV